MRIVILALAILAATVGGADARGGSHAVSGYTRSNGTYVAPHMSANPGTYSGSSSSGLSVPSVPDHSVSGYFRADGTYVQPHMATDQDQTRNDNYSTRGNMNPYTGTPGTKPRDEDLLGQAPNN